MNDRVKNVLSIIIEKFKSGDIPEAVALATFPIPDTPSAQWSFTNRTLMFISGKYIQRYAKKMNLKPYNACLRVLSETEKVLNTILQGGSHAKSQIQA